MRLITASIMALALMVSAAITPPASAQGIAETKIAILDMSLVERNALAFQDLLSKYQSANAAFEASARESDTVLRNEGADLQQQRAVLSPDAFNQRVTAFSERQRQLQEDFKRRKASIEQARLVAAEQVKVQMREILFGIMQEQDLNLILNSSNVQKGLGSLIMMSKEEIDITKRVIAELDQRIQTVSYQPQ